MNNTKRNDLSGITLAVTDLLNTQMMPKVAVEGCIDGRRKGLVFVGRLVASSWTMLHSNSCEMLIQLISRLSKGHIQRPNFGT